MPVGMNPYLGICVQCDESVNSAPVTIGEDGIPNGSLNNGGYFFVSVQILLTLLPARRRHFFPVNRKEKWLKRVENTKEYFDFHMRIYLINF
jgi:hypothetical protein